MISGKQTATSLTSSGNRLVLACDFETTVYEDQDHTEVWSAALVPLGTEDVLVCKSIDAFFAYIFSLRMSCTLYFHNLKFDGTFILYWLKHQNEFTEASDGDDFLPNKDMPDNSYKYLISMMGEWYTITIKRNNRIIEIRDSLKLLPFSLKVIGESFGTKHKKLEMEYSGYRYAGCEISDEELAYIKNDVLVLKEALEIMFDQGHNKITIGSCCLNEFKKAIMKEDWLNWFPDVYKIEIPEEVFGSATAGDYIRKSYKGGWCYVAKGKEQRLFGKGVTLDVNSLYPSMMHSESGNRYPIGQPHFWQGDIPDEAFIGNRYYFVRIKTRFKLKPGMLPFIQVKNKVYLYRPNECLETSDVIIRRDGKAWKQYKEYMNPDGTHNDGRLVLTLTMTDYELIQKHYDLYDTEVLDGCWFHSEIGIFDEYINHWKKVKQENKGAIRQLAKLMLNNLYGKLAASPDSSFKICKVVDDKLTFKDVRKRDKQPGYIPIGSAIPSYARRFTTTAAQENYYGKDKPGFIYADTDSIHCDLSIDQIKGVRLDPKEFCCWKHESTWADAFFTRQKTYIEHVIERDGEPVEIPYYDIKCAGMPGRCKYLMNMSMTGTTPVESSLKLTEEEQKFVSVKRTIADFKPGLVVPGKLIQKRIPGGCVLCETKFEMN